MTIWFDVEDLFRHTEGGGGRTTGIQRLTLEIYGALQAMRADEREIGFLRHAAGPIPFAPVTWDEIESQFRAQSDPPPPAAPANRAPRASLGAAARRLARRIPEDLRKPLVSAAVSQAQAVGQVGRFGLDVLLLPRAVVRRRRAASRRRPGHGAAGHALLQPGDTLLVLGSPWFREDYGAVARWVRDQRRMRFGVLMHDLVPIRHPQWTHEGTVRVFEAWYSDVLPHCDLVLANSRFTAADVEAYARENQILLPGPVIPVPVGTGFGPEPTAERPVARNPQHPEPGSYVLFVSTMEARKNHALVFRIWARLLAEVRAGRRSPGSVPTLVFAGRIGWLVADLVQQLENTDWLDGGVRLVTSPTDAELRALYAGALFTIYPSLFEGWGLPVTESLAEGKPCLCSDAASLPEAGGALCRYFDPEDLDGAYAQVCAVLDDRDALAQWEQQVRRDFQRVPWTRTARAVLEAAGAR